MIKREHRNEAIHLIDEAAKNGCRLSKACNEMGITIRTCQRWKNGFLDDQRRYAKKNIPHKLSEEERQMIVDAACSKEYRHLTPHEIVPKLLENNIFIASVRSFYRVLKSRGLLHHRSNTRPKRAKVERPKLIATGPNQVWCWDITFLPTYVAGMFFYAYMIIDMYSKKIVGWKISDVESQNEAKIFFLKMAAGKNISGTRLHSDNSNVMKGGTIMATIYALGLLPSFSRPRVSNDNAYIESFFKTLKYSPKYPGRFSNIEQANDWMYNFVNWYNNEHCHSSLSYVTPEQCHTGKDFEIFKKRNKTLMVAYAFAPQRFSKPPRVYKRKSVVILGKKDICKVA